MRKFILGSAALLALGQAASADDAYLKDAAYLLTGSLSDSGSVKNGSYQFSDTTRQYAGASKQFRPVFDGMMSNDVNLASTTTVKERDKCSFEVVTSFKLDQTTMLNLGMSSTNDMTVKLGDRVTYMVKKMMFDDSSANLVWGAAAALIYATPAIGGFIGDKLLGTRRTMLTGAVVLAFGYAMLWIPTNAPWLLYLSLGVIIVGNGFFKPNAGNLVRKIYEGDAVRIDSAFTVYYMAVNVGSAWPSTSNS